jgi:hypothetical protein
VRLIEVADIVRHVQPLPSPFLYLDGAKGSFRLTEVIRKPKIIEQAHYEILLYITLISEVLKLAELILRLLPPCA